MNTIPNFGAYGYVPQTQNNSTPIWLLLVLGVIAFFAIRWYVLSNPIKAVGNQQSAENAYQALINKALHAEKV
jgi:hypothetical protein